MKRFHVRRATGADQPAESFLWLHPNGKPEGVQRDRFLAVVSHRKASGETIEIPVEIRMIAALSDSRLKELLGPWKPEEGMVPLIRISKHYRDLLEIDDSLVNRNCSSNQTVDLEISPTNNAIDAIRACLLHPQLIARVATRLGVLGAIGLPASLAWGCLEGPVKILCLAIAAVSWWAFPDLFRPWRARSKH